MTLGTRRQRSRLSCLSHFVERLLRFALLGEILATYLTANMRLLGTLLWLHQSSIIYGKADRDDAAMLDITAVAAVGSSAAGRFGALGIA